MSGDPGPELHLDTELWKSCKMEKTTKIQKLNENQI